MVAVVLLLDVLESGLAVVILNVSSVTPVRRVMVLVCFRWAAIALISREHGC